MLIFILIIGLFILSTIISIISSKNANTVASTIATVCIIAFCVSSALMLNTAANSSNELSSLLKERAIILNDWNQTHDSEVIADAYTFNEKLSEKRDRYNNRWYGKIIESPVVLIIGDIPMSVLYQ